MPWYKTGTVAVTNNSTTVTGTGTAWPDNTDAGQAFIGPDGLPYEIAAIVSATSLTLASAYKGATASGQAYRIMPVQGYLRDLAAQASELVLSFAAVRDGIGQGIFPSGSVGTPGFRFSGDEDTGIYRPGANILALVTAGTESLRILANGFVGMGTTSPTTALDVQGPSSNGSRISVTRTGGAGVAAQLLSTGSVGGVAITNGGPFDVYTSDVLRMRIDGSGFVGIGTSSPRGGLEISAASPSLLINESDQATDGRLWRWNAASGTLFLQTLDDAVTTAGNAMAIVRNGVFVDRQSFYTNGSERLRLESGGIVRPGADNTQDLGHASFRWAVVRAGTGTIATSDARAKQDINPIAEAWLDAWGAVEWVRYKFIDAVIAKAGTDEEARWHVGLVAQQVRDAFAEHGLDAREIGLLCYDEWEEEREPIFEERQIDTETVIVDRVDTGVFDAAGQPVFRDITEDRPVMGLVDTGETRVTREAGDRWGLRYDECQAMEAAWQRRELARRDAVIAAQANTIDLLEARLEALEAA